MISYKPFWDTLNRKKISQYYLLKSGIDNKTLDGIKKGKNITLLTLEKLCALLECTPNDIVEFLNEKQS
ncbi:MAG: helix-turn-helix domain-containing protein [Lachnospiraceae bacterium]|nr:helix-turn-helix domain-containing protein [Lachnospiraceae bacterium]